MKKHILKAEGGDVEFDSEEELLRYFKGEIPELKLISEGHYKAIFTQG